MKLIKNIYYKLFRSASYLREGIKCKNVWYGNNYGGFYVYPDVLNEHSIIYSFGIGRRCVI
jgi:hypothetical protein